MPNIYSEESPQVRDLWLGMARLGRLIDAQNERIAQLEQELADEKRRRRVLSARFDSREMAS